MNDNLQRTAVWTIEAVILSRFRNMRKIVGIYKNEVTGSRGTIEVKTNIDDLSDLKNQLPDQIDDSNGLIAVINRETKIINK